jgi:hypothetical protein
VVLILSMINFLGFGLFHLSKFETIDEHFWKYKRVEKYWRGLRQGVAEGEWKKTRINDKPGVTVAIVSGVGLLFGPNPLEHEIEDPEITQDLFTVFDHRMTEQINFSLRLPILLINFLLIPVFFWLIWKVTNWRVALLTTVFIGFSPVLIGMSQIINPDSLHWTFSGLAIFSFLALLKKSQRKFLVMSAIFTGLALLSKYTANILFILFLMMIFIWPLFARKGRMIDDQQELSALLKEGLKQFLVIFASSVLIYALLLPAAIENLKYLYLGTVGSPTLEKINWLLLTFIVLALLDLYLLKGRTFHKIYGLLKKIIKPLYLILLSFFLVLFSFILINPRLASPPIPLDDVKEVSSEKGELTFPQLEGTAPILKEAIKFSTELQPLVFTLSTVLVFALLIFWAWKVWKREDDESDFFMFTFLLFSIIYFLGLLISDVMANPRYSIMLYVPFYFLGAIAICKLIALTKRWWIYPTVIVLIMILGFFALWKIKPHYLIHQSWLLPKNYTLVDSWGYGQYEAAQFLNSLEDAEELVIWSDRPGVICQFFVGKCLKSHKIDLSLIKPDYFVLTRRGVIRHKFKWTESDLAAKSKSFYYSPDAKVAWEGHLGGREKNYIKVIESEE